VLAAAQAGLVAQEPEDPVLRVERLLEGSGDPAPQALGRGLRLRPEESRVRPAAAARCRWGREGDPQRPCNAPYFAHTSEKVLSAGLSSSAGTISAHSFQ
jgi:hypothetical protein